MTVQATSRFQVNSKLVTSKMIDGEAIIINLSTGMYYSLEKTGAVVWMMLGGSYTLDEAAKALCERFSAPIEKVREDVIRLVKNLLEQDLVVPAEDAAGQGPRSSDTTETYETPVLNSYNDMGDVLALDPPLPQVAVENDSWKRAG